MAVVAGLALAVGAGARAGTTEAPDPTKLALAKRYYGAMHMERTMDGMMRSMVPVISQSIAKANPNLTEQERTAVAEAATESAAAASTRIVDRITPIIAETFTEQELRDLVNFYEGPTGQAIVDKMPTVMAKFAPQMKELVPEMEADSRQRICARIDCSKLAKAPPAHP